MFTSLGELSLDLLRAFEAAARLRSFTAAAAELGTTQPAVSQQIKRLEEQLAIRLFDRIYRGIELTDAGYALFEAVQGGLRSIDDCLSLLTTQIQHEVLQVSTDFHQRYPQVDVSLVTSERSHAMLGPNIDVAVLFGDGRFRQGESHWLFNEDVFPVCSPRLLNGRTAPLALDTLLEWPLLHLRGEGSSQWFDWSGLFRALHIPGAPAPGQLRFDNYTLLIQAAIAGQGVAIGWRHLVDELLEQQLLCRPFEGAATSELGYLVVVPQRKRRGQMVQRFVDWVMEEQSRR